MTRPPGSVLALASLFMMAGSLHFVVPEFYLAMMPPWLPAHRELVVASGIAEIVGGVGVLAGRWRRPAGIGLLLLLLAVFPANVQMLINARAADQPELLLWLRLPLQFLLFWWVWRVAVVRAATVGSPPRSSA